MKLLIMGAGYVGMALLTKLQNERYDLFITTTKKERVESLRDYGKGVLLLHPDDEMGFRQLVESCDGAVILVAPDDPSQYEEVYLNTAKKFVSALKNRRSPFYLLYTGSTSVCEGASDEWVTEESSLKPKSENAKILLETERIYLNSGVDTCILRLGGIYGPKRDLAQRARRFSGKEIAGTGDEPTNHIHLNDIVNGIVFCLDHSLTGVYHLVNDDHRTRKDLYSGLCQSLGIPLPIWNRDRPGRGSGSHKVSNQKIKEAGFVFTFQGRE
jgi:nucleoside-diphosphate-sugar epimerase